MNDPNKPTLMQLQVSTAKKLLITTGLMAALIIIVYVARIPNPNIILFVGLVFCSALFGCGGGLAAAGITVLYSLYFFSIDNSFVRFTGINLVKVITTIISTVLVTILVCRLKQQVINLTDRLHHENNLLQTMSLIDGLTGIRNRTALRQDFESYHNREAAVMMLDLNDFKHINDNYSHEEGDRILKDTGKLLVDTFGESRCYRYGGDEFLVIAPDITEAEFESRLDGMMKHQPVLAVNGELVRSDFSVGYVYGEISDADTLRSMICAADEKMYEAKREKKRRTTMSRTAVQPEPEKKTAEYTGLELRKYLDSMSAEYDLARVVDPIECRILDIDGDGKVSRNESCYCIWDSGQKCINCSSAAACRTGRSQEKKERFQDNLYNIQSKPVKLKLDDGDTCDAVVELVTVEKDNADDDVNNRASENIGNRSAHYRAIHDSLTDALNADAFYELARELIVKRPERSWTVVTGNIMNFRLVNTLFGVMRGNQVLISAASLLTDVAEGAGGLCGRIGGDQFALLIPADAYSENALRSVAKTLADSINNGVYTLCIHFGVYRVDDPSLPVSVMCGRANSALYTIRDRLTETVAYFDDAIMAKTILEQRIISGFEDALAAGDILMYLQPLADRDGKVFGGEALARWHRPDGTVMQPSMFIEVLERSGLIQKLDMYIWELAVKRLAAWKNTPLSGMSISVNMSALDFYSIDVFGVLTGLTDKYDVDCNKLRLEITETALLGDPEKSGKVISRLRGKGFIVEIDDFGKGYSSLGLLRSIQADVLKIDMSLLQELGDRQRGRTILEAVIGMAGSLGMDVIVEGIETENQLMTLASMGCNHFQGYYFSEPIPVEDFETVSRKEKV